MLYSVPEMNRVQQKKFTRQQHDSSSNTLLLCSARIDSLLAYRAIRASHRERGVRGRDNGDWDNRETATTCQFAE